MRNNSPKPEPQSPRIPSLFWRRDGAGWLLLAGRRRLGRVVPDPEHPGMYRTIISIGRLSDFANLSWVKNSVLVAAETELAYEAKLCGPSSTTSSPATDPQKPQQKMGVFRASSSPVRQNQSGVLP